MAYLKNCKHLTKKNTSDFILEIKLLIKIHDVLTLVCHTLYFLWMSSLFIINFFLCTSICITQTMDFREAYNCQHLLLKHPPFDRR
jgi:hypothetical protein